MLMKRVANLYNKICDIDVIMELYDKVIKVNTRNRHKIQRFENYYCCNIKHIKEVLISKNYTPGKYNIFLVKEPKLRIIMSQDIVDKVINHLVAKYFLVDVFDKSLLDRNFATRVGKGSHYALRIFKNDYNYFMNKYVKFYILKLDISKYFYNLDHDIIKELVRKKIKDKDALILIDKIIDSTDEKYVNDTIKVLKDNMKNKIINSNCSEKDKKLEEIEKLPYYEKGKGLCIGNMVSQIVATFYLDELDKFIEDDLKCKYHGRYMYDFYIMHYDKEYLKYCLKEVEKIINKYKLELNRKTKIYCSNESIEFLGFMFSSYNGNINMRLTNKTKKKFKYNVKEKYENYTQGITDFDGYRAVRDSYRGHLSYGNCFNLYYKYVIIY